MKVFDRYEGIEVELPEVVEPGRFRLLRAAVLNGNVEIGEGEVLWSDGGSRCSLVSHGLPTPVARTFKQPPLDQDVDRPDRVIEHALRDVVRQMDTADGDLPSPVMPAQLDAVAELHALELKLREALDAGHLDQIARRPRMEMRYDAEVLPVSRAKRLAPDMLMRLASHSEDWQRRDITGVVPSRLKAEVSEDELVIYENVLFVRLLQRLQKWLHGRIADLKSIETRHEAAMGLQSADRLHYLLRFAICSLWGRSFDDQQSATQLVIQTRKELQYLRGRVRQLLCSDVARAVIATRQNAPTLRDTNILRHDPHYSSLRPLWILAHEADSANKRTPRERYAAERQRGALHLRYVELLLRHALMAIRPLELNADKNWSFGPWTLSVKRVGDEWVLALDTHMAQGPAKLWVVPGMRGHRNWRQQRVGRLVVFCLPDKERKADELCGGDSVLNALEFYGVERVRCAIESWLLSQLVVQWPFSVDGLPNAFSRAVQSAAEGKVDSRGRTLRVFANLTSDNLGDLVTNASGMSPAMKLSVATALSLAALLGKCRICREQVPDQQVRFSSGGYKASCNCGYQWTLSKHDESDCEVKFGLDELSRPFEEVGSLALKFATQQRRWNYGEMQ